MKPDYENNDTLHNTGQQQMNPSISSRLQHGEHNLLMMTPAIEWIRREKSKEQKKTWINSQINNTINVSCIHLD